MKFARLVFLLAGIWGFLILTPLFFMEAEIARQTQPLTHPEYYYAFLGVAISWQVLFLLLSRNPAQYRLMIIPAVLEKLSFAPAAFILLQQGRTPFSTAAVSGIDLIWAVLFIIAFFKTANAQKSENQQQI